MSVKKDCVLVEGNAKCQWCLKGKKGCKFLSLEDEEEEEEEEEAEEDEEEAVPALSKLPVAKLKKISLSPICSLCKRKEDQLSLESQKEKAAMSSALIRAQREPPEVGDVEELASVVSMPPPSIMLSQLQASSSSCLYFPSDDYWLKLL